MLPVHLQPESHVPLYIQLRDQLRALVHAGDLRPGDRIPASRELATTLGVHRTTVANAYAELESEGLIQGHVGRGTFILLLILALPDGRFLLLFSIAKYRTPIDNQIESTSSLKGRFGMDSQKRRPPDCISPS